MRFPRADGKSSAESGSAIPCRSGTYFLEFGEFLRLSRIVTNHDGRAVGSLYAEQPVAIDLVGRENHVKFRVVQIEPCKIARHIIVGKQGASAESEGFCECRIVAQIGGFVEILRHRDYEFLEGQDMVGNRDCV